MSNKDGAERVAPTGEPRDTYGPAGTNGCACVSRDARMCVWLRYGGFGKSDEGAGYGCECMCHEWARQEDQDS